MSVDHIRYDLLVREALRGVVRRVVSDAGKNGLPGDHHFFISFDTRAPGVKLSPRLREQHPQEMTIVLQHQFWDLTIEDDVLEVGLSFGGVPERLVVPLSALKGFFDPSVQFGLEFEVASAPAESGEEPEATSSKPLPAPRAAGPAGARKAKPSKPDATPTPAPGIAEVAEKDAGDAANSDGGAEVVRLDRFRKK